MHPAIAAFPSGCFYDGRIADGVAASARPPPGGFAWPRADFPVAFVPTPHHAREQGDGGTSKSNAGEVEAVVGVLHRLLAGGLRPDEIGVVTPYAAQVGSGRVGSGRGRVGS